MAKKWVYAFNEVTEAEQAVGGKWDNARKDGGREELLLASGEQRNVHAVDGETWDKVRALLGGKGANLADMTRLGVPVPPGFIVTTEACNAYSGNNAKFPEGMWEQVLADTV